MTTALDAGRRQKGQVSMTDVLFVSFYLLDRSIFGFKLAALSYTNRSSMSTSALRHASSKASDGCAKLVDAENHDGFVRRRGIVILLCRVDMHYSLTSARTNCAYRCTHRVQSGRQSYQPNVNHARYLLVKMANHRAVQGAQQNLAKKRCRASLIYLNISNCTILQF